MKQNPYSAYAISRKSRRKFSVFTFAVLAIGLVVVLFVINISFGFVKFGTQKIEDLTLPIMTVWLNCDDEFEDKKEALTHARDNDGFVAEIHGKWHVIIETSKEEKEGWHKLTMGGQKIHACAEHHDIVQQSVDTFFQEIDNVRERFIQVRDLVERLDDKYSDLIAAMNKQLMALHLLEAGAVSEHIAKCMIIFAYKYLTESV